MKTKSSTLKHREKKRKQEKTLGQRLAFCRHHRVTVDIRCTSLAYFQIGIDVHNATQNFPIVAFRYQIGIFIDEVGDRRKVFCSIFAFTSLTFEAHDAMKWEVKSVIFTTR